MMKVLWQRVKHVYQALPFSTKGHNKIKGKMLSKQ